MKRRILILSCNTGEGHNASARALKCAVESRGMRCDVYDTLSLRGEWISKMVSDLYGLSVRNSLFGIVYDVAQWYSSLEHKPKSPVYQFCRLFSSKLRFLLTDNGYDAVICTHLFPAIILTDLKSRYGTVIPTFFVSTDYTCYPFLNETDMDGYMIAHRELVAEYIRNGLPKDRIYPTGIPSSGGHFEDAGHKYEARKKLDAELSLMTRSFSGKWFLVMGGSMGFGNMNALVDRLLYRCGDDDRIICVCGNNLKQKKRIDRHYADLTIVKAIGFTDRVPLLMNACDVLLTKPGGLTSTEALNRNVPLVHTSPIKGLEDRNASFFHERKMSYSSSDPNEQAEQACRLCIDPEYRTAMLEAQRSNSCSEASNQVIEIMASSF